MKKWLYWGIPAIVLVALLAWRFSTRTTTNSQAMGPQGGGGGRGGAASVEVAPVASRVIVQSLQSVGNVESPYKVEISPKSAGRISYLQVREGDVVAQGEVLLKIDPSELEGALAQAQANVAETRSRLAQAKITQGATDVGVTSQIKQQKAGVSSAQADYNQVLRNYDAQVQSAQSQVSAADSAVKNAQASLDKENATLSNTQIKYDRTYSLYKQGYIAAQDVDDARTALDVQKGAVTVARGQVDAAKSQLNVQQQNLTITKRKGQSDIAASKAKLTQALATLDVANANRSQAPAYRENISALQAVVDASVAQVKQAQVRLSDTVVRSSISGTVTARKADPGALASPGSPVVEVQFLDWLYITTSIPIESSAQVVAGQTAQITFDSLPGRTFTGPIVNLNEAADPLSRQFSLRIRLANPGHVLRPGMYAHVSIETGRVDAKAIVPREAVINNPDGTSSVAVVDKNVAHVRPVKLGVSDSKGVQITEGVQPGETVVVLSASPIKDGQKVTVGAPGGQGPGGGRGKGRKGGKGGGAKGGQPGGGQ